MYEVLILSSSEYGDLRKIEHREVTYQNIAFFEHGIFVDSKNHEWTQGIEKCDSFGELCRNRLESKCHQKGSVQLPRWFVWVYGKGSKTLLSRIIQ